MDCRDAVARLSADIDDVLEAGEAAELRRHLQTCAACTSKRVMLEQARQAFRGAAHEARSLVYVRTFALTVALVLVMAFGNVMVRMPEPVAPAPVGSTAGIDCGLPGGGDCFVDVPCRNGECSDNATLIGLR